MGRKPKYGYLLDKSIHAAISAIEIYNKPDFKYREESFSILMVNAWELLLKSRILQENNNNLKSIYVVDHNKTRKDGKPYKYPKYKTSRSGNYLTIDIKNAIKETNLHRALEENLHLLIEIRDNAVHFLNKSKLFEKKVLEIGTASLRSYVEMVNKWFDRDLSKYNFFLMPISFFHHHEMKSFSINDQDKQHKKLLEYIASKEKEFPSDETNTHNISLVIETKWKRSKSVEALTGIKYDEENPDITFNYEAEQKFQRKYPWSWTEGLKPKLKERYKNLKFNREFWDLKKELEKDDNFCGERPLDWNKPNGTTKKFYSTNILKEFDKHYTKK